VHRLLARGGKVVGAELLGGNFPSLPPSDRKGAVTRYKGPDRHGMSGTAMPFPNLPRRRAVCAPGPVSTAANGGLVQRTVQAVNACAAQRNASLDRCSIDRAPSSLRLAGGVVSKIY
jgi:hypothetical protein